MSRRQRRSRDRLSLVDRRRATGWRVTPRAYACRLTTTHVYGELMTLYTHQIGAGEDGLLGYPEEFGAHLYDRHSIGSIDIILCLIGHTWVYRLDGRHGDERRRHRDCLPRPRSSVRTARRQGPLIEWRRSVHVCTHRRPSRPCQLMRTLRRGVRGPALMGDSLSRAKLPATKRMSLSQRRNLKRIGPARRPEDLRWWITTAWKPRWEYRAGRSEWLSPSWCSLCLVSVTEQSAVWQREVFAFNFEAENPDYDDSVLSYTPGRTALGRASVSREGIWGDWTEAYATVTVPARPWGLV